MKKEEEKQMAKDLKEKDSFSTYELADAKWFPINSVVTVIKLIKHEKLSAINLGISRDRFRISRESIIQYMQDLDEQNNIK